MLLWIEHATIDVVLCASSVSMLEKLPILIVPPGFGRWACASDAVGAAAREAAPPGQIDRARQLALQQPRLVEDRRAAVADGRNRRHQRLRVGMERLLEQDGGGG